MKVLSNIFMDESKVSEMVHAKKPQQIYDMLIQMENEIREN